MAGGTSPRIERCEAVGEIWRIGRQHIRRDDRRSCEPPEHRKTDRDGNNPLGIRASSTCELVFADCRVGADLGRWISLSIRVPPSGVIDLLACGIVPHTFNKEAFFISPPDTTYLSGFFRAGGSSVDKPLTPFLCPLGGDLGWV